MHRCVNQHAISGLTSACLSATASFPHASIRAAILAYIRDRVPTPNSACLAGNTVHADKVFLVKEMPELIRHLHYRIVDVSSIKELVRRWYGPDKVWKGQPTHTDANSISNTTTNAAQGNKGDHRALNDIRASIAELKYYRQHIFKPAP